MQWASSVVGPLPQNLAAPNFTTMEQEHRENVLDFATPARTGSGTESRERIMHFAAVLYGLGGEVMLAIRMFLNYYFRFSCCQMLLCITNEWKMHQADATFCRIFLGWNHNFLCWAVTEKAETLAVNKYVIFRSCSNQFWQIWCIFNVFFSSWFW